MPEELYIPIIQGTIRRARESIRVAKFIESVAQNYDGIRTELVDPADFHFVSDGNDDDNKDPRYSKITSVADAFFIVVPEYNHSFPGSLKMLLDTELANYIHKPVTFAGVSSGSWGGVRAIEALNQSVREMGLVSIFSDVHFPKVQTLFDEKGKIIEAERYTKRVNGALKELVWMARTLKWGRTNLK